MCTRHHSFLDFNTKKKNATPRRKAEPEGQRYYERLPAILYVYKVENQLGEGGPVVNLFLRFVIHRLPPTFTLSLQPSTKI